ncbi:hypothetical protein TSAR_016637 [Trichomalopsis sarcophagae]|uniref:Uncharacterized protein n=1 Tax=Trichomalopsis sarcophagae TaxID=543379 RepID=A0A232EFQ7_9HYME|nr:hypothetical protein TSAR_016637 [Trichomalopsis sarcophagae]
MNNNSFKMDGKNAQPSCSGSINNQSENILKFAHVVFTKDLYSKTVPLSDIKCDRNGKESFKPKERNDFIMNKKYYVKWYDCTREGDICTENHNHDYELYSAFINCLGVIGIFYHINGILMRKSILKNKVVTSLYQNRVPNRKYVPVSTESDNEIKKGDDSEKLLKEKMKKSKEDKQRVLKDRNKSMLQKIQCAYEPAPFIDITNGRDKNTKFNISSMASPVVCLEKINDNFLSQTSTCAFNSSQNKKMKKSKEDKQRVLKDRNKSMLQKIQCAYEPAPFIDITNGRDKNTKFNISSMASPVVCLEKINDNFLSQTSTCAFNSSQNKVINNLNESQATNQRNNESDSPVSRKSSFSLSSRASTNGENSLASPSVNRKRSIADLFKKGMVYSSDDTDDSDNEQHKKDDTPTHLPKKTKQNPTR